jgi:hypothetical protein
MVVHCAGQGPGNWVCFANGGSGFDCFGFGGIGFVSQFFPQGFEAVEFLDCPAALALGLGLADFDLLGELRVHGEAVKPCLRAFCAERALPSGVRGPVDPAALARLAASCSGETE